MKELTYLEKVRLCRDIRLHRMKWGIRRFVNDDGSLTAEGQKRYKLDKNENKQSNQKEEG